MGVVLYEMMTLKHPFDATNMEQLLSRIVRSSPPPPPKSYSIELRTILDSLLQKAPAKRPSVNALLKLPYLSSHVPRYLSQQQLQSEFSHTILHSDSTRHPHPLLPPVNEQVPAAILPPKRPPAQLVKLPASIQSQANVQAPAQARERDRPNERASRPTSGREEQVRAQPRLQVPAILHHQSPPAAAVPAPAVALVPAGLPLALANGYKAREDRDRKEQAQVQERPPSSTESSARPSYLPNPQYSPVRVIQQPGHGYGQAAAASRYQYQYNVVPAPAPLPAPVPSQQRNYPTGDSGYYPYENMSNAEKIRYIRAQREEDERRRRWLAMEEARVHAQQMDRRVADRGVEDRRAAVEDRRAEDRRGVDESEYERERQRERERERELQKERAVQQSMYSLAMAAQYNVPPAMRMRGIPQVPKSNAYSAPAVYERERERREYAGYSERERDRYGGMYGSAEPLEAYGDRPYGENDEQRIQYFKDRKNRREQFVAPQLQYGLRGNYDAFGRAKPAPLQQPRWR